MNEKPPPADISAGSDDRTMRSSGIRDDCQVPTRPTPTDGGIEPIEAGPDATTGSDSVAFRKDTEPGRWLAWSKQAEAELLDPRHPDFDSRVAVLGSGARVDGDRLNYEAELLCRLADVIYLLRQQDGEGWVVAHCARYIDEYPGVDEVMEGRTDPRCIEQLDVFIEAAETDLFPPSEYFEWLEGAGSNWYWTDWSQEIVNGKAMWVPCARYFLDELEPVLDAARASSDYGPMTSVFIERVFEYDGHQFVVTGDPEGGELDVDVYQDGTEELPEDWISPMSMMVDVNGVPVSIGYDEDEAPSFADMLLNEDDEVEANPGEASSDDLDLRRAQREASQLLANLRIVHNGVEIVGPNASSVLPSHRAWLAFPTSASLTELDAKVSRIFVAEVSGRSMVFTDNMELAVAARLTDLEPIIRITHDTVEIADPSHEAIVARTTRLAPS